MMDQQLVIDALRSSTQKVFSTMLGLEAAAGPAYSERTPPGPSDGLISLIGMAGPWIGTGSLGCSQSFECRISGALLMTEIAAVNEEVLDALAELTNMIFGNFKTTAEEYLGPLGLTIPTVIHGYKFSARSPGRETWTVAPFACDGDRLELKLCLVPNRGLAHLMPNRGGPVTR